MLLAFRRSNGPQELTAADATELAAHLADARIVDIEGGMVPLPDQLPEAFAHAVLDFLDAAP